MADNKLNFTDNRLRTLRPVPGKKRSYYYDIKTAGLRLQITAAGTMTFQFQARYPKQRRPPVTVALGKYPTLSINEARKLATGLMTDILNGVEVEDKINRKRHEYDLDTVFNLWLKQFAKPHKKSWGEDVRRYDLYIRKPLGKNKLSWFTTAAIRNWHRKITTLPKQRGKGTITPATANRSLALLSTVFNQMVPEHPNPCRGVKKFKEDSRDRFLQPEELQRFFEALEQQDTPVLLRDYVLVSLFTGSRRSNVLSMEWREISFERSLWTIPGPKSKNGEPMDIPLVKEVVDILERRKKEQQVLKNRFLKYVFPGKTLGEKSGKSHEQKHYSEPKKAWGSLLKRAGLENVRIHDLRRTMGSYQTMTGASSTIVGKTLGHKSPEATAVYARLNLDPVRSSMESAVKEMQEAKHLPKKVVSIDNA